MRRKSIVGGGPNVTTKTHDAGSKTTHDVKINVDSTVNVTGMENASKHLAIGATVVGVLDKMQSLLAREGDVVSTNLANLFKSASSEVYSLLKRWRYSGKGK